MICIECILCLRNSWSDIALSTDDDDDAFYQFKWAYEKEWALQIADNINMKNILYSIQIIIVLAYCHNS